MDAKTISVLEKLKPIDIEKCKENFRKKEELEAEESKIEELEEDTLVEKIEDEPKLSDKK
jgi:hypothetical protein